MFFRTTEATFLLIFKVVMNNVFIIKVKKLITLLNTRLRNSLNSEVGKHHGPLMMLDPYNMNKTQVDNCSPHKSEPVVALLIAK